MICLGQGRLHSPSASSWYLKCLIFVSSAYIYIEYDSVSYVAIYANPSVTRAMATSICSDTVAIKASFLKLGMCNMCKNNIAKMFLGFFKFTKCSFDKGFLNFW